MKPRLMDDSSSLMQVNIVRIVFFISPFGNQLYSSNLRFENTTRRVSVCVCACVCCGGEGLDSTYSWLYQHYLSLTFNNSVFHDLYFFSQKSNSQAPFFQEVIFSSAHI